MFNISNTYTNTSIDTATVLEYTNNLFRTDIAYGSWRPLNNHTSESKVIALIDNDINKISGNGSFWCDLDDNAYSNGHDDGDANVDNEDDIDDDR